ncbi:unnamed protein product [Paramecium pentaurelia]|uniref:Uncharacterized protein n=1 Tax=Paramecium pentaurelia TaxID=43138 RepID=A0A8S1XUZ0_9CILI|nr:unnamed protein product [Paramecium pentaurelia]
MSNIKIVYQRKVHKLPQKITSYQEIVETIKSIYPQIKEVHLFTIINPTVPDGIEEINSDLSLIFLKKMYKQMGWPTIKLLVLENENDEKQIQNSLDLLNQSTVILDQSNYQDKPKIDKAPQKQVNDYRNDEKIKQTLIQIIDERLRYHNLLNSNQQENELITKTKQLSQVLTQYSYDWLLEFVKQQGAYLSYEHLLSLLTKNQ